MSTINTLPTRIKELRLEYGLSLNDVAMATIITAPALSQWETNKRQIGLSYAMILADFYAVSLDWLVGRSTERYNNEVLLSLENECKFNKRPETIESKFEIPFETFVKINGPFHSNAKAKYISIDYDDPVKRVKNFSLKTRADIIVMVNLISRLHKIENIDKINKLICSKQKK